MKLEPFGERIIVKKKLNEKVGLIHIPDSKQKASIIGEVLAVGPDANWVKPGDMVLFGKHAGFELPTNDDLKDYGECMLMNCEDLLSKISPNGEV